MSCTITDKIANYTGDGTELPVAGVQLIAVPDTTPLFIFDGVAFRPVPQPIREAISDVSGNVTLVLPTPSETSPGNTQWLLHLPNGAVVKGTVPEASGPFTVSDLIRSHGWGIVPPVAPVPTVVAVEGPPGPPGATMITPNVNIPVAPLIRAPTPTVVADPPPPPSSSTGTIAPPQDGAIDNSLAQIIAASAPANIVTFTAFEGAGAGGFGPTFQFTGTGLAPLQNAGWNAVPIPNPGTQQQVAQAIVDAVNAATGTLFPGGTWNVTATLQQSPINGWYAELTSSDGSQQNITVVGAGGSTFLTTGFTLSGGGGIMRSYRLVVEDADGNLTDAGTAGSASGDATLDNSHVMHITWIDVTGTVKVHVFRSQGSALDTLGYIGVVNAGVQALDDSGQAGDGSSAPVVNHTGHGPAVSVFGLVKFSLYVTAFNGTWHAEISSDAGATWNRANPGADADDPSGAGFLDIEALADFVRLVLTSQTGSPPTAYYRGLRFLT